MNRFKLTVDWETFLLKGDDIEIRFTKVKRANIRDGIYYLYFQDAMVGKIFLHNDYECDYFEKFISRYKS